MRGENGEFLPLYLYPRAVLDSPPSVRSGHLSVEGERLNRALGCILIAKAGHMLTLPQSTICAAQILLHRFYFRVSMHKFKLIRVCLTSLFVASKVEETPVRLRCVLAAFDRLLKRRAGLDPTPLSEQRFDIWAQGVASCEGVLLRELGFELYVDLPHAFILHFLGYLHPRADEQPPQEQRQWAELRQRSWNALNDALLWPALLFAFPPPVLACAAIVVAASLLSLPLPSEWWLLFDVPTAQLDAAALEFAQLYALLSQQPAAGGIDYTPAHPTDDNENNNELCRYRPRNRQQLLEQKREAAAAAAAVAAKAQESSGAAAPGSSPVDDPAATAAERKASGNAPMET